MGRGSLKCNPFLISSRRLFPTPMLSSPKTAMASASSSSSSSRTLKIGMIGFGTFAQFLANIMTKQGHTLTATSRSDYSNLCSQLGITFIRDMDMDKFLDFDHDVILLCTSIVSLSEVVRSIPIHRLKTPATTLFTEVLSVKEHPRDLLLQALPEESDVLCTHPMFGPVSGKDGWKGLPFMFDKVRIRNEDNCSRFLQIFENEGCRMVEMTCEEHDKMAARSQFLTHTVGRVLAEMEIVSTPIDTNSFQQLVQLKDNMVKNSYDLYRGLFLHNKYAKEELENLELALQTVKQKLLQRMEEE